jgi:peptidoglycan/LPS O-acetylase OafA/YrhL
MALGSPGRLEAAAQHIHADSDMDKDRFYALDAIRGMAALVVLVYHVSGQKIFPGAWVAVDLFFVLSGFVIHHSYQMRLDRGLSFAEFMSLRLIRLGPLYLLALAIGAFTYTAEWPETTRSEIWTLTVKGLFFVPHIQGLPWPFERFGKVHSNMLFPLNAPSWSLFYEIAVNVLFFYLGVRWLKGRGIVLLVLVLLTFLALTAMAGEYNAGWRTRGFLMGAMRVSIEFYIGVLIYQHRLRFQSVGLVLRLVCAAMLLILLCVDSKILAMANAVILAPLSIALLCGLNLAGNWRRVAIILGDMSFPLYITHAPVLRGLMGLDQIRSLGYVPQMILVGVICILFAWMASKIDAKLRHFLMGKLRPSRPLARPV